MNVVEASGLGKRYGRTWALRECTLAVPAGHVAALVGPNGAATCPAGIASVHSRSAQVFPYRLPRPLVSMTFMRRPPSRRWLRRGQPGRRGAHGNPVARW